MLEKKIDPGAEASAPRENKLEWLISFIERQPYATLTQGEAKLLVDEIHRLRDILNESVK